MTVDACTPELCNATDDDCDGVVDEVDPPRTYFHDTDGDGYGAASTDGVPFALCAPPIGFADDAVDCDDSSAAAHPGAFEECDGVDSNCSGDDEDRDGDGFIAVDAECEGGLARDDCDDREYRTRPGAYEECDGIDSDCSAGGGSEPLEDADGDGFVARERCLPGMPIRLPFDCNDADASVYPGAAEVCDGVDLDCSLPGDGAGGPDPGEYVDADGDGAYVTRCSPAPGPPDCDDANPTRHPDLPETCNGVDDDCDLRVDGPSATTASCATPASCIGGACSTPVDVEVGIGGACVLSTSGRVSCWSARGGGPLSPVDDGVDLSVGLSRTCVVRREGTVRCWSVDGPSELSGVTGAVEVAAGERGFGVRTADGTVWSWGSWGVYTSADPTREGGLTPASGLAAGGVLCSRHGMHSVRCTGCVLHDDRCSRAEEVFFTFGALDLAVGREHACIVDASEGVRCWGQGRVGQLGDGTVGTTSSVPVSVAGISDAVQVAVGESHSCARLRDRSVWCWGGNASGQIGDGSRTDRPSAVRVLSGATDLAAGGASTCAVLESAALVCWGEVAAATTAAPVPL